jgi:antitoxin component of MazEF toxin-antitoxin module
MMWIRKIGSSGQANVVVLPPEMLRALLWRRGDHLSLSVIGEGTVVLMKVEESRLSDSQITAAKALPTIEYE